LATPSASIKEGDRRIRKNKVAKVAEMKDMSNTNQLDYSLYEGSPSD